ncbi:MAG TPA: S41 family peptidase [Vicinamibacterales bacterium]|nr:S41 family peptidase [Vicinamibacterales bacterium]
MTRSRALLALFLAASLGAAPAVGQAWRAQALASFDEVWQTVHDRFYDPTFGGLDWDAVKAELRPKVEAADSAESVRQIIRDMLGRLHQSHFVLLSSESVADTLPGEAIVPVEIRVAPAGVVITRVTAGSSAEQAGLHPGDVILSIGDQPISAWTSSAAGNDERARNLDVWRKAYRALHGDAGSRAALKVRTPAGVERSVTVTRATETGQVVKLGNLPPLHVTVDAREVTSPRGRHVGYIGFNVWMGMVNAPIGEAVDKYRQAAGLIIDLRGNPGGLAAMISGLAGQVMSEPLLLGNMQMREAPTYFKANPRFSTDDGRRVTPFAGPVAIIVDELSASASECFAGALQSLGRARIFGRQTMGQALPASTKQLPNGDVLMYALSDFVTSTGRRLEGAGVVPDEAQPLSVEALAAGRDLALEAALRWIDTGPAVGK